MDQLLNEHIGRRLRLRRRALGLSQAELADRAGLRFRQIHKYECAENRTSSATLWRLACALDVNVHYFFEGLRSPRVVSSRQLLQPAAVPQSAQTAHAPAVHAPAVHAPTVHAPAA
jgi:transcriptional regulator with XRE-family HTH domain